MSRNNSSNNKRQKASAEEMLLVVQEQIAELVQALEKDTEAVLRAVEEEGKIAIPDLSSDIGDLVVKEEELKTSISKTVASIAEEIQTMCEMQKKSLESVLKEVQETFKDLLTA